MNQPQGTSTQRPLCPATRRVKAGEAIWPWSRERSAHLRPTPRQTNTRTGPADRGGSWRTGTSRSPPPGSRTSGSREIPAQRSAASPGHRADRRPAHGRFRSDCGPVGAVHSARVGEADRRRRRWPRRQEAQGARRTGQTFRVNELPNDAAFPIAEMLIVNAGT